MSAKSGSPPIDESRSTALPATSHSSTAPIARPHRAGGFALRSARAGGAGASSVDIERPRGALHNFPRDHHLLDTFEARQLEHGVEQDALHDRAQPPRAGLAVDRLAGDGAERFLR